MLRAIERNEPLGIGFNEIQRIISCSSKTVDRYRRRLLRTHWIEYDSKDKFHLTQKGKNLCQDKSLQSILVTRSNKYPVSTPKFHNRKNKLIDREGREEIERRESAYILLSIVAALGNHNYKQIDGPTVGDMPSSDTKLVNFIQMTPTNHKPGVGLSDFTKNEIEGVMSTLDKRRFVAYNEAFAYLDLTAEELHQYISELKDNDGNPILREIAIADYEFLSYVYDIENCDPDLILFVRDSANSNKNQVTYRVDINNNKSGVTNFSFYHDIYCNKDDFDGLQICSKLVFNINGKNTRQFLGLDRYYKNNNDFSVSTFKEKRYIIANERLRDLILLCYNTLNLVWGRMEYARLHDRSRPKYVWTRHILEDYVDWYKLVFGYHRRIAEYFLRHDKTPKYQNLDKKDSQVIYDLQHKFKKHVLSSLNKEIIKNYTTMRSKKFAVIRKKIQDGCRTILEGLRSSFSTRSS